MQACQTLTRPSCGGVRPELLALGVPGVVTESRAARWAVALSEISTMRDASRWPTLDVMSVASSNLSGNAVHPSAGYR